MSRSRHSPISSSAQIAIFPADASHLVGLRQMYATFRPREAGGGVPRAQDADRWLTRIVEHCRNWVATTPGRVVGHSAMCVEDNEAEFMLFVHQDARRIGIGRKLLGMVADEARRQRLHCLWSPVDLDNIPMLRLATSMGFQHGHGDGEIFLTLPANARTYAHTALSIHFEERLKAA